MKSTLTTMVFLSALLLSACTLPFMGTDQPAATLVAVVTTEPAAELESTLVVTDTRSAEPSVTLDAALSDTPTQLEPTATEQTPPTAAHTSSPTAASTSETEQPPVASDPAGALGAPDFHDSLDSARVFPRKVTTCFETAFEAGWMSMRALGQAGMFCWQLASAGPVQNFFMQVISENRACEGGNRFGLFIRAPQSNRGYMYGLTCDGQYTLSVWDGKSSTVLAPPTPHQAINAGGGALNRIGVQANDSVLDLYANGSHLERLQDDTFTGAGRFGFFVQPFSPQGFTIAYRDLELWLLDGEVSFPSTPAPQGTPLAEDEEQIMETTDSVNVRSGPGNEYPSLGRAPEGTLMKVIGFSQDGRWAFVLLPPGVSSGGSGWVSTAYLKLRVP
jgi:hypothetical protein